MTKRELVAPPVGTIYQVRRLVTDSEGKPIPGMAHSGFPLRQCRVLQDACLHVREGVYVDLYRDIYRPAS